MNLDIVTLFPEAFAWFRTQRHVANVLAAGSTLTTINPRDHTPLSGGQVDDAPFGGGAGMVLRVDVIDAALRAHYELDPVTLREQRRVVLLSPAGRLLDDALVTVSYTHLPPGADGAAHPRYGRRPDADREGGQGVRRA